MKKYWYIVAGIFALIIIVSIVLQETKGDYFRLSAEEAYLLSQNKNLLINDEDIAQLKIKPIILSISESESAPPQKVITSKEQTIITTLSDLLNRENRKHLRNNQTIIVQARNYKQAACAWVVLVRRGYKNVHIYNNNIGPTYNYTFQPEQEPG